MVLYVNGVDGATGRYLPPLAPEEAALLARQGRPAPEILDSLRYTLRSGRPRGLAEGDPDDLAQAGWGVIFAAGDERVPALREKLKPLLRLREGQASTPEKSYYRELVYKPGESKVEFLSRHEVGPGLAEPARMPYYLLIVGDPETISFEFQYQLDIEYAVGRIHFDTMDEYATYAAAVKAAEGAPAPSERRLALFGTRHPGDPCTDLSFNHLVAPLATRLAGRHGWKVDSVVGPAATKSGLADLLGGPATPDLLFTASHGVLFGSDDPQQLERQGALVCQDWPGPEEPVGEEHSFASDDVGDAARVAGLVSFQFACFTAGSPAFEDFAEHGSVVRQSIAPHAFLAKLPRRLLAHPRGGALAVIGHVERAYPCSIEWPGAGRQIQVFQHTVDKLMAGHRVGHAMECFGKRYAEISCDLEATLDAERWGRKAKVEELANLWTASRDTRNYMVVGDPAVRLPPIPVKEQPPAPPVFRGGSR